ncbi:MAG: aromatic amino acid lyase [Leptospiraceae bacterium]|nr:aromatic amino acid lyase [Leptospiraceae bacterium]
MLIDPHSVPEPAELEALCLGRTSLELADVRPAVERSRTLFLEALNRGETIYGSNTGYGPFVEFPATEDGGQDLLQHLLVGTGPLVSQQVVRGAIALRIWTMSRGFSGLRWEVIQAYVEALRLCEAGLFPAVPVIGSLGASGDLIPLAHLLNCIIGKGHWIARGGVDLRAARSIGGLGGRGDTNTAEDSRPALLDPSSLDRRAALACTNGISFSKAQATLAFVRLQRLLGIHEILVAALYALLDSNPEHLHEELHSSSANAGTAMRIRRRLQTLLDLRGKENSAEKRQGYALQAPYSIRCAPQILGACFQGLDGVGGLLRHDLSMVDDNPLLDPDSGRLIHGGNFFGQSTAFAADQMATLACQSGVLAERQLALLLDPEFNASGLMLATRPGISSGLAGLQLKSTALVAEMRSLTGPHSTSSIPTNGKNQDIVPMSFLAARRAYEVGDHLSSLLSALFIAIDEYWQYRFEVPVPLWKPDVSEGVEAAEGSQAFQGSSSLGQRLARIQSAFVQPEILDHENLQT